MCSPNEIHGFKQKPTKSYILLGSVSELLPEADFPEKINLLFMNNPWSGHG